MCRPNGGAPRGLGDRDDERHETAQVIEEAREVEPPVLGVDPALPLRPLLRIFRLLHDPREGERETILARRRSAGTSIHAIDSTLVLPPRKERQPPGRARSTENHRIAVVRPGLPRVPPSAARLHRPETPP